MDSLTFSHNLCAFEYAKTASQEIEKICEPLFSSLGFTIFAYIKVLPNGKMLHLNSSTDWTKSFFENAFYNEDDCFHKIRSLVSKDGNKTFVLSGAPEGKGTHCSALYDANIWNTYSIYKKRDNHVVEGWAFGTTKEHESILELYLNEPFLLHAFTLFFSEKTSALTTNVPESNFIHTERTFRENEYADATENLSTFLRTIYPKRFPIRFKDRRITFTQREVECLSLLAVGCSSKEIARELDLSSRTIECYINNAKAKVGVHTKSEIIKIYADNFEKHEIRKICKILRTSY